MSLPRPPVQRSLFDVQNLIGRDFDPDDRFRLGSSGRRCQGLHSVLLRRPIWPLYAR